MALARARSVALVGVEGHPVEVECDLASGLPTVSVVGLPDAAVGEARDRVRAAVVNSGQSWPSKRITFALSPADLRKHGSRFDLAMAVSLLAASEVVPQGALDGVVVLGELGLDGKVRPVRGVLPAVNAAARSGVRRVIVPAANAAEAALVSSVDVLGAPTLADLVGHLTGEPSDVVSGVRPEVPPPPALPDLAEVAGQPEARRGVEVAAAGGHNLFLTGSPGAGKTMCAERLPGILPPLGEEEALEVTAVHSVAGLLSPDAPLVAAPPFQAPHHTASIASLVGGGSGVPRPGAITCAHRGVLFLDEAPEFAPHALDALREPMERGEITVARAAGTVRYPARFQLALAANPCPCSAAGDPDCVCPSGVRRRYLSRLSGPLLDRIDVRVAMLPVRRSDLAARRRGESSAVVGERVAVARRAAAERLAGTGWRTNSDVPGPVFQARWPLPRPAFAVALRALETGYISARGVDRVTRVAWTIADLDGRAAPTAGDASEALMFRVGRSAP